jgi:succinate-acetate transporter protein
LEFSPNAGDALMPTTNKKIVLCFFYVYFLLLTKMSASGKLAIKLASGKLGIEL